MRGREYTGAQHFFAPYDSLLPSTNSSHPALFLPLASQKQKKTKQKIGSKRITHIFFPENVFSQNVHTQLYIARKKQLEQRETT